MSINAFIDSWGLFGKAYALTLLAAALSALVGVVCVARRQVFIAAAIAQASTFGYALFVVFIGASVTSAGGALGRDLVVLATSVSAAMLTLRSGATQDTTTGRLDSDERTAWLFIFAGAGSILALAGAPAGMEQFRRLQTSSVIGANARDLFVFCVLLGTVGLLTLMRWRALVLWLSNPVMASAIGMRPGRWNLGIAAITGLCVGLTVRSAGMLFAFGCLALPVMIAKQWVGEVRTLLWLSPLLAVLSAITGLWLAYALDLPPGQVVVMVLCMLLATVTASRAVWELTAR